MFLGVIMAYLSAFTTAAGAKRNLAEGKPTFASTSWENHIPENCVDGKDRDSKAPSGVCLWCTTIYGDMHPWWGVDLKREYDVDAVVIILILKYSRSYNLVIELFDKENQMRHFDEVGRLCSRRYIPHVSYWAFDCDAGAIGRFLRIKKTEVHVFQDPLAMCEVFVYGTGGIEGRASSSEEKTDKDLTQDKKTDKVLTSDKEKTDMPFTTDKEKTGKALTADKEKTGKALTPDKEKTGKVHTSDKNKTDKVLTPYKEKTDKALTTDKDKTDKVLTPYKEKTGKALTTDRKTELPSLFACEKKDNLHVEVGTGKTDHCPCFCRLPLETLPDKYQKLTEDIRRECKNPI